MIRVLVVDDSRVAREGLAGLLGADPEIEVVGVASNGQEALEAASRLRPDVITMDIQMPLMNGYEATQRIMERFPTPIVIVSGSSAPLDVARTFRALEAGALSVVPKPAVLGCLDRAQRELLDAVKAMSEVKVVRRWPNFWPRDLSVPREVFRSMAELADHPVEVVAIGASTGGPEALRTIFKSLRRDFAFPVLVVQHMARSFIDGFGEWLSEATGLRVHVARQGEPILPGNVYLAPDGFHMGVGPGKRTILTRDGCSNAPCPSVAYLFHSITIAYGPRSVGVLLTGMGKDGARELKEMKQAGAVTVAQDEASSVIYGMPGEAVKLGAAAWVLPPEHIAALLNRLNPHEG